MAKKSSSARREVTALRQEVKNLATQLSTAVGRIEELEVEKKQVEQHKPPKRELTMQEEVQALRREIGNLALALDKAVGRIREMEEHRKK